MIKIIFLYFLTALVGVGIGWGAYAYKNPPKVVVNSFSTSSPKVSPTIKASLAPSPTASSSASPSASLSHPLKEFFVTASDFKFVPSQIKVKIGDKVRIHLKVIAGIHNISIPAYNVFSAQIMANQTSQIEFTADEKGVFQIYCDVEDHQQKGMVGNLIVN